MPANGIMNSLNRRLIGLRGFPHVLPVLLCSGLLSLCVGSCSNPQEARHTVRFAVLLHGDAVGREAYLCGSTAQLGQWNPSAIPLKRESDSVFSTTLTFPYGEALEYKITAGSWWTEALDSTERLSDNLRLVVRDDTAITLNVYDWLNRMSEGQPVIDAKRFRPRRPYFTIDGLWRYSPGDSLAWASPRFDDRSWVVTDPFISWTDSTQPRWDGIGWFRFHLKVDSSLWNTTLAMRINQLGASEIYYNGRLLYRFGTVGATPSTYMPKAMSWWQQLKIDPQYDQLIAVRYSNPDSKSLIGMGYQPGFLIIMKDVNTAFRTTADIRVNAEVQIMFTLIPLILFLIHLSFYGFLRSQRQNLYYALCMLGFAGLTYFNYERNLVTDVGQALLLMKLSGFSVSLAVLFGVLTILELNYGRLPGRAWVYVGMAAVTALLLLIGYRFKIVTAWNYIFFGMTAVEGIITLFRKAANRLHGDWMLAAGFLLLTGFVVLQMLVDYGVVAQTIWTRQSYAYGMASLAVSMSVFLSYNFARVNKDLQIQLANVQELSRKAFEQELLHHRLELERKTIEIENERKSKELESARTLQLSLLPKQLPRVHGLEIACLMKTATEVGGDYYDFFNPQADGVTIAIGDATSHGLKAGNMVFATKGLLNALSCTRELETIMTQANRAIKQMNLHMLTMGLAMLRIEQNAAMYSSAGMPPLLIYRAQSRHCEHHVLKAMPLGAVTHFPYTSIPIALCKQDVVVMMSDGLVEMFNADRDTFGMDRVSHSLQVHAEKSADDIVRGLFEDARAWAGETPLADDLTLVIVKITSDH